VIWRSHISAVTGSVCLLVIAFSTTVALAQTSPSEPEGEVLIERLRQGGLVIFFRHADTTGMSCDRLYRIGQRLGQRNISENGKIQSRQIGAALTELEIPIQYPVLAGPVFRARDTAELAFGERSVEVIDGLLADDYAGGHGVSWVIREHRRLFVIPPKPDMNRILVGHRTPAIIALSGQVNQSEFPEGAAIIMLPQDSAVEVLGVISFVPPPNSTVDRC
jgi:phosphohistidine phosphatase SixA